MARYKKSQECKNKDVWTDAGGRDAIIKAFIAYSISKKGKVNKETWSNLAMDVFKMTNDKLCKWLMTIWNSNRQALRTEVLCKGKRQC